MSFRKGIVPFAVIPLALAAQAAMAQDSSPPKASAADCARPLANSM